MNNKSIDIHGMTTIDAKKRLEQAVASAPSNSELIVIHGYHGGQTLQNMVRKGLKHKRIKQRILSMNAGETVLVLE